MEDKLMTMKSLMEMFDALQKDVEQLKKNESEHKDAHRSQSRSRDSNS